MRARLTFTLMVLAGCAGAPSTDGVVRDWSFTDTDGVAHSDESSAGKPALLFFMATWCTKCQATAPRLAEAYRDMGARAHFYTVSWDPTEDDRDLRDWKAKYGQAWPHGLGRDLRSTFAVNKQSTLVFLDGVGTETERFTYATPSLDQIRAALAEAGA